MESNPSLSKGSTSPVRYTHTYRENDFLRAKHVQDVSPDMRKNVELFMPGVTIQS